MTEKAGSSASLPLPLILIGFVAVGAPMAYYIWHTLSELLSGRFDLREVAIAAALLVLLFFWLRLFGRYLSRH